MRRCVCSFRGTACKGRGLIVGYPVLGVSGEVCVCVGSSEAMARWGGGERSALKLWKTGKEEKGKGKSKQNGFNKVKT